VLEEYTGDYFEQPGPSPFMLFICDVKQEKAARIAAVRHVDGTARIQTVSERDAPLYHRVIRCFMERTGIPVVVNTSFNTGGEPIVCTPEDAVECYFSSPLDALAIGPYLLTKSG
jgi:carbamoyltransferase